MKCLQIMLDTLFPRYCISCGKKYPELVCKDCLCTIQTLKNSSYKNIISAFSYKNTTIKSIIRECKFRKNTQIISCIMDTAYEILMHEFEEIFSHHTTKKVTLVPIPLHPNRKKDRGFNQSELICLELKKRNPELFEIETNALLRTKDTPYQSKIKNREERLDNVKKCFTLRKSHSLYDKHIILVDDVTTTGATLEEAMKTIQQGGIKNIHAFTLAQ